MHRMWVPRRGGNPHARPRRQQRGGCMEMSLKRLALGAAVVSSIMLGAAPAQAWEPTKPVEIIVAAGAGGASDQMARMMQAAIQKHQLVKQPIVVTLKGGASGAEGLMDMKASTGDAHKVL